MPEAVPLSSTAGGPFVVRLDVTDGQGAAASCSTMVTVTPGGGGNTPPVANNDRYTTEINTPLLDIPFPGVLGNDTDADSDPLTAVLDSGT